MLKLGLFIIKLSRIEEFTRLFPIAGQWKTNEKDKINCFMKMYLHTLTKILLETLSHKDKIDDDFYKKRHSDWTVGNFQTGKS